MTIEKLKGHTITDNFLHFKEGECVGKNYRVPWDKPNTNWKIFNVEGYKQVVTNVQYDATPHAPDLFIYTNVKAKEDKSADDVAEDCVKSLDGDRRWYVKQITKSIDRAGIRQFATLPLGIFMASWRRAIPAGSIDVGVKGRAQGLTPVGMNILGDAVVSDSKFRIYIDWPELERVKDTLGWLKENCQSGVYLFSDADSMFVDPDEEFAYIASCMRRDER